MSDLAIKPQVLEAGAGSAAPWSQTLAGVDPRRQTHYRHRALLPRGDREGDAQYAGGDRARDNRRFSSPATSAAQRRLADALLRDVGDVEWVDDEALIDAVTAVSGSGPAYVFYFAECLAEAGIAAGLPQDLAALLARATVSGAGELLHITREFVTDKPCAKT